LSFAEEAPPFDLKFLPFAFAQPSSPKFREINVHWDNLVTSGSIPWSPNSLSPSRIAKSVVFSSALGSHHGATFNPICVLGSCRIGPVVERDRPRDRPVDYCLSESRI
jgi:hypothetical protein